jgi:prepilin-type N-terminal cleavage/methylation domain-containing protein
MNDVTEASRSLPRRRNPAATAFTLIELLVVIAIIAILAGLLLPALGRAKDRTQLSIDRNNNRQIMTAMTMYTTDNQERMPHPSWGSVWDNPGPDNWCYLTMLDGRRIPDGRTKFGDWITNQLPFFQKSQLGPFLSDVKVVLCPKDMVDSRGSKAALYKERGIKLTSYSWNGAIISYGGTAQNKTHKITSFKSMDIVQWETDDLVPFYFNDAANQPHEGISQRHSGGPPKSPDQDVKGGATVGIISGSTTFLKYNTYYDLAGGTVNRKRRPSFLPNELWCDPQDPRTGGWQAAGQ